MPAIQQPGVTVNQVFTATESTVASPALTPVIVGPCYHVVDAVTSSNTFDATAKAGSYAANVGTQSFSLPGLSSYTGAILDTASIKVYLDKLNGTPQAALRSVSDESTLISATSTGTLTAGGANPVLTDSSIADFSTYGVTKRTSSSKGDVVRITYLGRSYDLEIIDLLDSADASVTTNVAKLKLDISAFSIDGTSSVLDSPLHGVTLSTLSYNVIDKPADYVVRTAAANAVTHQVKIDSSNYFHFEAQGTMAGAAAETANLKVVLKAAQNESGTDNGYADGSLFVDTGAGLGSVTVGHYVLFDDSASTKIFVANGVIAAKIGAKVVGLTADAGFTGTGKNAMIGPLVSFTPQSVTFNGSSVSGAAINSDTSLSGAGAILDNGGNWHKGTFASGIFTASGGASNSTLASNTVSIVGHVIQAVAISGTGQGGANTFASATLGSGTSNGNYLVIGGSYLLTSSGVADNMITISGITAKLGLSWVSVPAGTGHSSIGTAAYSASTQLITITLNRDSGTLPSIAQITSGLTSGDGLEFDPVVTALVKVSGTVGSGDLLEEHVTELSGTLGQRTYPFEGGYDANQVVLDGNLTSGNAVSVYISYRALRVDLSAAASDPSLITINSIADITAKIGRSDTLNNPLGLAAKLALTNTVGNTSIKVLGLSAANSSELTSSPNGSATAYSEALSMLESEDVYALAPLSSDREIATLFSNHATSMSAAANKAERIAFVSRAFPQYSQAQLIVSGSNASTASDFNTSGTFTSSVDFGASGANFALLQSALAAGDDVILVLSSFNTATHGAKELLGAPSAQFGFRVSSVNSNTSKLNINVADIVHSTATNDLSSQSWKLYVQGKAITSAADQATRTASFGSEYANRRAFLVWPPRTVATVGSTSEFLDGHFLAATIAGMVGFQPVGKGFTNLPISGFTGLRYSNRHFSKSQLDEIAGGGTMIVVQDVESGPLKIRHQLATDVSTVQKRELSITKQVDFFAKTLRDSLADRIGGSNITSEFIQGLGMHVQAVVASMVQRNIVTSANVTSIVQDTTNPDTINIVIQVAPLFPCNYIEITLQL